jgi:hypothetical protein
MQGAVAIDGPGCSSSSKSGTSENPWDAPCDTNAHGWTLSTEDVPLAVDFATAILE